MERPAESAEARKPDIEANIGHAPVGFSQQEHRALDPTPLEVAVRGLAKRGAKGADEMCFRDASKPGQIGNVKRLRIRTIHRVAGPKHPPIDFLNTSAHRVIN